MSRFLNWLRKTFSAQFITFVAGLLTSVLIRAIFGQIIPLSAGILNLATILLVVLAVAVIVSLRNDINASLIRSKLSASVHHALKTTAGDFPLYDPVIQSISSAQESVRVIGLFRPPTMEITPGREKYYRALDEILDTKHRKGERFRYERILQVKEVRRGTLGPDQIDRLTYAHCAHLLQLQHQKTSLTINLRQIPDILGSLSFLIVDDKEVIFVIPTLTRTDANELEARQLGTGVIFTDQDGSLMKEMLNLFDDLRLNADPVLTVVPEVTDTKTGN